VRCRIIRWACIYARTGAISVCLTDQPQLSRLRYASVRAAGTGYGSRIRSCVTRNEQTSMKWRSIIGCCGWIAPVTCGTSSSTYIRFTLFRVKKVTKSKALLEPCGPLGGADLRFGALSQISLVPWDHRYGARASRWVGCLFTFQPWPIPSYYAAWYRGAQVKITCPRLLRSGTRPRLEPVIYRSQIWCSTKSINQSEFPK